jgi:hypothetical protein
MNTDPQQFTVDTDGTLINVDLQDSYGDGWNDGVLKIFNDQTGTQQGEGGGGGRGRGRYDDSVRI